METIEEQQKLIKRWHRALQIPKHYGLNYILEPGRRASSRLTPPAPPITVGTRHKALYALREAGIIEQVEPDAVLERMVRRLDRMLAEADRRTPIGRKSRK